MQTDIWPFVGIALAHSQLVPGEGRAHDSAAQERNSSSSTYVFLNRHKLVSGITFLIKHKLVPGPFLVKHKIPLGPFSVKHKVVSGKYALKFARVHPRSSLPVVRNPNTHHSQGAYYAYPPQGAPAPQQQQPFAVAGSQPAAATAAAAVPGTAYPGQNIRFDDKGKPTWGGVPWTGAPPR